MKRYCLADYILTVDIPEDVGFGTQSVSIGGEGSYLDSISISMSTDMFSTEGDATGSWIHTKSLDRTGSVTISVKQISDKIAIFKSLVNVYMNLNTESSGMTLTLRDMLNNTIAICEDCVISKIPDQEFSSTPSSQSWTFNAGRITFVD